MRHAIYKIPIIFLIVFFSSCCSVSAQDFYRDYRKYLTGNGKTTKKRMSLIDTSIKRLRMTINRFEHDNNKSFFLSDTIFMVDFQGAESGVLSTMVWTRRAYCYYEYSYVLANWKKINEKFDINTNAFDILKSFNQDFRNAIENIDTGAYHKYADSHKVFDGEWVSPLIGIKTGNHWRFVPLKGNGWAIDYDPPLKKPDTHINTNAIINNLSKKNFGFDIDSASAAYLNDTSKFKKQPSYPVILLNGKVITYNQLRSIEPYKIKAISVWSKNSHNTAIPNGISSEFGVIEITTNDKSN